VIIILVLYASEYSSVWWWPAWIAVIGFKQWMLSDNIGHWASHKTLFKKKSLNEGLEWLYFFPVFTTWKEWKDVHVLHHGHVGGPEDPQTETFRRWGLSVQKNNFWHCFLLSPLSDFKKNLRFLQITRNRKLTLFWIMVLVLIFFFNLWKILLLWLISYFISRVYVTYFSETSEHWNATPPAMSKNKAWGTRNLTGSFYAFYKPYSDVYHREHHENPNISPSQLPAFYKAKKEIASSATVLPLHNLSDVLKELT
jgi:fatty acid desaturase